MEIFVLYLVIILLIVYILLQKEKYPEKFERDFFVVSRRLFKQYPYMEWHKLINRVQKDFQEAKFQYKNDVIDEYCQYTFQKCIESKTYEKLLADAYSEINVQHQEEKEFQFQLNLYMNDNNEELFDLFHGEELRSNLKEKFIEDLWNLFHAKNME